LILGSIDDPVSAPNAFGNNRRWMSDEFWMRGLPPLADLKLKHYHVRKGRGYWLVTPKMRTHGFDNVRCGADGPQAWAIALEWEDRWQRARKSLEASLGKVYPKNSVGDAFARFRKKAEWSKKPLRTREDWERGWKYIEPFFGGLLPSAVTMELLDGWYAGLRAKKGIGEAGRAVKTWRALYNVMASMKLCTPAKILHLPFEGRRYLDAHRRGQKARPCDLLKRLGATGIESWRALLRLLGTLVLRRSMYERCALVTRFMLATIGLSQFGAARPMRRLTAFLTARSRRLVEAYLAALVDHKSACLIVRIACRQTFV
jgi:hypothetical protein